ncbi:MAG TPA: aldo/keto reductase [Bacteroidota bacterium]|nr:aldo/keto reductase [Bacteroidota bacterium]
MQPDFTHTTLGKTGLSVHRLGFAASYRPGEDTVRHAAERGMNLFFGYGMDKQLVRGLRPLLQSQRERYIVATGAYNYMLGHTNLRRSLETRLRQFGTEYIDLFLFLGVMREKDFPLRLRDELILLKQSGKVRFVGMSGHNRQFAGRIASEGGMDVLMVRYNAAHRGAEEDVFPQCSMHNPGIISYTATRWRYLLRAPKTWPASERVPTAPMCYRFVLSHPGVHVALSAPRSTRELDENIDALARGPLDPEEDRFMRSFGDAVHQAKKFFM